MTKESRIEIYDYLADVFKDVTPNLYSMKMPTENTEDDKKNGFVVTSVGTIIDNSEFSLQAFGRVRCYVTAYVPFKTRGRLDKAKYAEFETAIWDAIHAAEKNTDSTYYIEPDSYLSMEDIEDSQSENQYAVFIKSFVVNIDETNQQTNSQTINNETL